MKHNLTVPCFLTGKNITIKKSDKPVKKYFPRVIPRTDRYWNTGNDHILIHWKTVRKFTVTEMVKRTGFSTRCINNQLERLGLTETVSSIWVVSNDKILKRLWLEGLKGRELAEHFNVSPRTISIHLKRLGLRKHKR